MSAWTAVTGTTLVRPHPTPLPPVGVAWALLAAWPLLSLVVSSVTVDRRDV